MHSSRLLPLVALVLGACATGRDPGRATPGATATATASSTGTASASGGTGGIEFLNSRGALSQAVRVGNILYLSGQLGTDSARGITPETRMAMEKIKANVERFGSSMDRVVKCTVFLVDMSEWGAMNAVYTTYFAADKRPARSAVGSSGLVGGGRVEIECIAIMP
jgi:2-iminobutanoate/2-iminopropanoate deaminase